MKKLKRFLLLLLSLTTIGCMAVACETAKPDPDNGGIENPDNGGETPVDPEGPSAEELAAMGETLKAAYELATGATMEGTHTLTGTVTNVAESGDGEACLTFVVEGYDEYPMYCYWLKGEEAGNLEVGDVITVTGTIKNYNGTVEYDKANLDKVVKAEKPDDGGETPVDPEGPSAEELAAMGETLKAAYELATGATMEGTHTLTGKITEVKELGDGEARVVIVVEGYDEYPMYCYWLKGEEAGNLAVNDIITVTGTIKNYKGTVEFDKPTLDKVVKGEKPELVVTTQKGTGIAEGYDVITIEMAQEICAYVGEATTVERYYIQATIDSVSNAQYGEMYIYDETGSIKVYGTYSEDGSVAYKDMTDKPYKGAEVLLSCTLHSYNETAEVQNARLIAFENVTVDESAYTEMTVAAARDAADETKVKVEGVVAQITYANGYIPSGVYLVDETNSIYVYDRDLAARVAVGNQITILGEKTHWILDTETTSAQKFGYAGCNQIENAWLIANDGMDNEWDRSWVQEKTVKQVLDTPVTTDITTTIFKANAFIKEVAGSGFTNFYINDLDEMTGSYCYSQCNGGDFTWLREYDTGKVYTVYFSALNAKSSSTGCLWRFLPIAVVDEQFEANKADAPKFFVEYFGVDQFMDSYKADPALELTTKVSSTVFGVEAELSYTSSNTSVLTVEKNEDGNYVLHCVGENYGTATITVSCTTADGTYSQNVEIAYVEPPKFNAITVAEAIATAIDTEVTVKGIVGPSLVNQDGFYLFGEDGSMIAVKVANKEVAFADLAIGHEIYLKGMRERYVKDDASTIAGQTCIVNAEILLNNYGNHEYSTAKFVTGKTVADFSALDITVDYSTTVFVLEAKIEVVVATYYTNLNVTSGDKKIALYCSGAAQYTWLQAFNGQTVTLEVAACNWNDKTDYWRGCVLAVRTAEGKVLNTLNFKA